MAKLIDIREGEWKRLVPLTLWRCHQMIERWPWSRFDEYLDVPLVEIRRVHGIRVVA